MAADDKDHTFVTRFRIPRRMWDAYGTAATRRGVDRSEHELAELEAAERELAQRRARRGGRPRKDTAT
jgi:hypothetical protein